MADGMIALARSQGGPWDRGRVLSQTVPKLEAALKSPGNAPALMLEDNGWQIADIVCDWIRGHVKWRLPPQRRAISGADRPFPESFPCTTLRKRAFDEQFAAFVTCGFHRRGNLAGIVALLFRK